MIDNIKKTLRLFGYKVLDQRAPQANGADRFIVKNNRAYSVEIKKAKAMPHSGNYQTAPVEKNRRKDDFIAIEFPNGYVLFEPMKHHLKNCSKEGYRHFSGY